MRVKGWVLVARTRGESAEAKLAELDEGVGGTREGDLAAGLAELEVVGGLAIQRCLTIDSFLQPRQGARSAGKPGSLLLKQSAPSRQEPPLPMPGKPAAALTAGSPQPKPQVCVAMPKELVPTVQIMGWADHWMPSPSSVLQL
jgi:hypothetical protein